VEYLKNKIITFILFLAPLASYGQWSYTFTDPCTLNQQTIQMGSSNSIALNYFGNVQTFTQTDFTDGTFDSWMDLVTQANSSSPCESITQVIMNTTNSIVIQNTITVVTNVMAILGGDMLPQAVSGSVVPVAEAIDNSAGEEEEKKKKKGSSNNQSSSDSENSTNTNQSSGGNSTEEGTSSNSGSLDGTDEEETEGTATLSLANSISNAVDGGDADNKNRGSLIASGDIIVIDNQDNSNGRQLKVVGSITHANTEQSRIKGALFTYTSVTNDFSLTFYKSWINPKRTFNLVGANTTMTDFDKNHFNTTTALESWKMGKTTGMAGVNFTLGKLGERDLTNLSAVVGAHRNFRVSPKITTSTLLLGVYSPFTQFYEGKWWEPGILIVPFSSWDIKITKTFKYNISFTGVWHSNGNALNYQVLTGGKIRF
tara:strand:+ start:3858 stop:5138 length:1281 start_codon:yes stop_codon:yes gene_type:complete